MQPLSATKKSLRKKRKKPKQKSPKSAKFGKKCLKIGKILRGVKFGKISLFREKPTTAKEIAKRNCQKKLPKEISQKKLAKRN